MTILIALLFLAAFGGLFAFSRTLDDPIGRELDQTRGCNELRALLTPQFGAGDNS